eukprot:scaffold5837_cov98-Skeletonema_dohrnii-CCMP3373.AAC.1
MRVIIIAIVCYCLGITAGASHLRASVRNVRKDPESKLICIETRRNGPQTLIIEGQKAERDQVVQLMGDSAALGACDPDSHRVAPLNKKQKKMIEVCLKSEGERITTRLPRVTRREFKRLGAVAGPCSAPFSWIEIKLVEDDVKDTSASADISGKWEAEEVKMGASLKPPLQGSPITIKFGESGVSGSAGCNRIFGASSIESKSDDNDQIIHLVNISKLASTRKMCHPSPIMKQEYAFIKTMAGKTFSYKMNSDDQLEFLEIEELDGKVIEGNLTAVFKRIGGSEV